MARKWVIFGFFLSIAAVFFSWPGAQPAQASCGSVTCFVVIGSAQQVSPAGLLTVNTFYSFTPQNILAPGTTGVIPGVNVATRQMILDHHREQTTFSQMATLDLNYGITIGSASKSPFLTSRSNIGTSMGSVRTTAVPVRRSGLPIEALETFLSI
jgi:hypothetical protein